MMYDAPGEIPTDWTTAESGTAIERTFTFAGFGAAMGFMAAVAPTCERLDHHPEWRNIYDRVEVRLTTHHTGGLTDKDIALARSMDRIADAIQSPTGAV